MTLRTRLTRCIAHNLIAAVALGTIGAIASTGQFVQVDRPLAEGSPESLIVANDCWTGEAPADMRGVLPGHVVVTIDGVTRLGGERMVGKALEQIFDGTDYGLTVAAFCR